MLNGRSYRSRRLIFWFDHRCSSHDSIQRNIFFCTIYNAQRNRARLCEFDFRLSIYQNFEYYYYYLFFVHTPRAPPPLSALNHPYTLKGIPPKVFAAYRSYLPSEYVMSCCGCLYIQRSDTTDVLPNIYLYTCIAIELYIILQLVLYRRFTQYGLTLSEGFGFRNFFPNESGCTVAATKRKPDIILQYFDSNLQPR